jgi:hypothetical protein
MPRRTHLLVCTLALLSSVSQDPGCQASVPGAECDGMPAVDAMAVGMRRQRAGDFAAAVRCLERAAGTDVRAAMFLAEALLRTGATARALETLERVTASDGGSQIAMAHLLLGR